MSLKNIIHDQCEKNDTELYRTSDFLRLESARATSSNPLEAFCALSSTRTDREGEREGKREEGRVRGSG